MSSNRELRWTDVLVKEFSACPSPDGWSNNRSVWPYSSMVSFQGLGKGAALVPGLGCCINPQRFSDGLNPGAHSHSLLWEVCRWCCFTVWAVTYQSVCHGGGWAGGGDWQVVS